MSPSTGGLIDQQLSVRHLSRHELLLLITDGPHGRNLYVHPAFARFNRDHRIDYLYRERVFTSGRATESKTPGLYYVYPRRDNAACQHYIANSRSWSPSGLSHSVRDKLLESVVTLDVVTLENMMKTTAVFLMEILNQSGSTLAFNNTVIDSLVQNRAARVVVILDHRSARSNNLMAYMESVVTVIESGHGGKMSLFVHFDDDTIGEGRVNETLGHFDEVLRTALNGRVPETELYKHSFMPISVPNDVRLVAHLLGTSRQELEPFFASIRSPNFKFDQVIADHTGGAVPEDKSLNGYSGLESGGHVSADDGHAEASPVDDMDLGVNTLRSLVQKVALDKVSASISQLERDVDHLYSVSNKHVREDRSKEITNIIASLQGRYGAFKTHIGRSAVSALAKLPGSHHHHGLHLPSPAFVSDVWHAQSRVRRTLEEDAHAVPKWVAIVSHRYTAKQWAAFYAMLTVYYVVMTLLGKKFGSIEELDREKYDNHKVRCLRLSNHRVADGSSASGKREITA
ncbi:septation ring formation regulator EzrA [Babesia caballi]|uniref:Septation ring formation regulator EzrA n=1 Tax=Babesia caballi TaxID=5871 RepID=A0AAV4LT62_BABCB|nr:septation ring formation regulator EzrA [Babesia caballi]